MTRLVRTDGFLFYALVYLAMRLNEGKSAYLNPAITLSLTAVDVYLDNRTVHLVHAGITIAAQMLGAVVGAFPPPFPRRSRCCRRPLRTPMSTGSRCVLTAVHVRTSGCSVVMAVMPNPLAALEQMGYSAPGPRGTAGQAFLLELLLGWFLVTVVLAVRRHEQRRSSLLIGARLCGTGSCCC
jgi:glycerol uptake facilitator-like aquaporin